MARARTSAAPQLPIRLLSAGLVSAGLLVAGCAQPAVTQPEANNDPSIGAFEARPLPSPLPTAPDGDVVAEDPAAEPSPTWDAASRTAAVENAAAVMAAFARPQADERAWWAELAPLLTLSGQDAYAFVDPANVPARQVTGEPVVVDESSGWLARVQVPTDVGVYDLLLVREDGASPWLAEQITPPAALSEPAGAQPTTPESPASEGLASEGPVSEGPGA